MIDPKVLRTDPDRLRRSQLARGESVELVDDALAADETRRSSISAFEAARAEQKSLGALVARAKGDEKAELLARTKELSGQVKALSADVDQAGVAFDAVMKRFGNLVIDGVPTGGEDDLYVVETVGTPRDFAAEGITVRDHLEIGEIIGAIDMERGAKVSIPLLLPDRSRRPARVRADAARAGKGAGVGFLPMISPALASPSAMEGTGFLGQAAEDVYYLERDDLTVGTAEVPLAAYHLDEILDAGSLPLRYAGFSPAFRREAGSYGKDTRGIFRVHWFDKFEMFVYCAVPRTPRPSTNACWLREAVPDPARPPLPCARRRVW